MTSVPLLSHEYVQTNGITLHIATAGPSDGRPVILLHGFPDFWYGWRRQIGYLAERGFRVVAPDQRGYNLSDKPPEIDAYTLNQTAADVIGLMDAAGWQRACVVGHDWGGAVGWWLASKYPHRLERLVILNAPHHTVFARALRRDPAQMRRSWYMMLFQLPWLPERLTRLNNWWAGVRGLRGTGKPGVFSASDLSEYRRAWSQPGAFTAMINWYRAAGRRQSRNINGTRITVPTLIVWGAKDPFFELALAQASYELCEVGNLVYLNEAAHWIQHEEPEKVNNLIEHFLQESRVTTPVA